MADEDSHKGKIMSRYLKKYTVRSSNGTVREYSYWKDIELKKEPVVYSPEQMGAMRKDFTSGVQKKVICKQYGISYYKLNQVLNVKLD